MKRHLFLSALLAASCSLTGCADDDDNGGVGTTDTAADTTTQDTVTGDTTADTTPGDTATQDTGADTAADTAIDTGEPDTAEPDTALDTAVPDVSVDTGDDTGEPTDTAQDTADTGGGIPAPPELGALIDRFGRPAVATALVAPFADDPDKSDMKDAYNEAEVDTWPTFAEEIASNLAIFDSLDTVCGNQIAAGVPLDGRYGLLSGVLANDRLWVNTASSTCTTYLAVEANVLGIANTDCGGRTPSYDVIDITYSALAVGAFSGVGDGIADPAATTTTFPFLADPL